MIQPNIEVKGQLVQSILPDTSNTHTHTRSIDLPEPLDRVVGKNSIIRLLFDCMHVQQRLDKVLLRICRWPHRLQTTANYDAIDVRTARARD